MIDRLAEHLVRDTFARRDIQVGGRRPWDIQVRAPEWYRRMVLNPAFEIGETYMDGQWDCEAIDEMLYRLFSRPVGEAGQIAGQAGSHFGSHSMERGWKFHLRDAFARLGNPQSPARAREVARRHYDLAPDLFHRMLDEETMSYTCGYWRDGDSLGAAQRNKLRLICEKLELKPGETLLDVGCGFGGLAAYAAENYGVAVFGVTNSEDHCRVARERCGRAAQSKVELALMDYRELASRPGAFDKVASIEMIEAVGPKNFGTYMDIVHRCLRPGGRLLVQAFISDRSQHVCNEWFDRHIFPNGVSPSFAQLDAATAKTFGPPVGIEDIGAHYPPTLMAWNENFQQHWAELSSRFDERFRRMWHFYLTSLAGLFRAENLRLCQIVYSRA